MKLLVYSVMPVVPTNYGGAVRIYNIIEKLAEKDINITLVSPQSLSTNNYDNKHNINYVFYTSKISKLSVNIKILNKIKYFLNFLFFFEELFLMSNILSKEQKKEKIILQSEYIYSVVPLYILKKIYNFPLVITEHNIESELSFEINNNKFYYKILQKIEMFFLKKCDKIVCVSDRDKEILQKKYTIPCEKIIVGSNATNIPIITKVIFEKSLEIKKKYDLDEDSKIILFMGTLQYSPNKKAVEIIQNNIIPRVVAQIPKAIFLIVGKGVNAKIEGNVIYTGLVEDVNPYIYISDLAIAPLTQGGGTRLKILEYMAFSKPVVSTSKGAEGLDIIHDENIIISDNWNDFSKEIVDLLLDSSKRSKIGNNGRKLIEKNYTWESTANKYFDVYTQILEK